jgi:hypothetical protein
VWADAHLGRSPELLAVYAAGFGFGDFHEGFARRADGAIASNGTGLGANKVCEE